jgi:stress response protein YsnF
MDAERRVVEVVREEARVGKEVKETGSVVVHVVPRVETERVAVERAEEQVDVERVVVNRIVEKAEGPRQEGDVLVIPVYEEVVVVEKKLMLREELRVVRRREVKQEVREVELRREEAHVLRSDAEGAPGEANKNDVEGGDAG